jgi:kojibiose phosphorylase
MQNEAFETLAEPAFELWKDRSKTYAAQVSQERLYRSKNLKQADVLMMMFLFGEEYSDKEISQAWDYYVPVTTHDSSLSAAIHSILGCRLGKHQDSWDFWQKSSMIDVDFDHGGPAEGIHIAACAGNWMNLVYGFAGIKPALQSATLSINPALPKALTKIQFPIIWSGARVSIEITHSGTTVTHLGEGPALDVIIRGKKHVLKQSETIAA